MSLKAKPSRLSTAFKVGAGMLGLRSSDKGKVQTRFEAFETHDGDSGIQSDSGSGSDGGFNGGPLYAPDANGESRVVSWIRGDRTAVASPQSNGTPTDYADKRRRRRAERAAKQTAEQTAERAKQIEPAPLASSPVQRMHRQIDDEFQAAFDRLGRPRPLQPVSTDSAPRASPPTLHGPTEAVESLVRPAWAEPAPRAPFQAQGMLREIDDGVRTAFDPLGVSRPVSPDQAPRSSSPPRRRQHERRESWDELEWSRAMGQIERPDLNETSLRPSSPPRPRQLEREKAWDELDRAQTSRSTNFSRPNLNKWAEAKLPSYDRDDRDNEYDEEKTLELPPAQPASLTSRLSSNDIDDDYRKNEQAEVEEEDAINSNQRTRIAARAAAQSPRLRTTEEEVGYHRGWTDSEDDSIQIRSRTQPKDKIPSNPDIRITPTNKRRSDSSSWIPKISRWSETTTSRAREALRTSGQKQDDEDHYYDRPPPSSNSKPDQYEEEQKVEEAPASSQPTSGQEANHEKLDEGEPSHLRRVKPKQEDDGPASAKSHPRKAGRHRSESSSGDSNTSGGRRNGGQRAARKAARQAARRQRVRDIVQDAMMEAVFARELNSTIHTRYIGSPDDPGARPRRVEEVWKREGRLGAGSYGRVWLEKCGTRPDREAWRAVKEMTKDVGGQSFDYKRELEAILKFSQAKYSHCFVKSQGWFETEESVYITMEYVKHGDLQHHMKDRGEFTESEARLIASQLVEGLDYMHENGFAHRDLKPANVLVVNPGPQWWVKITDFGISKRVEGSTRLQTMHVGTMGYLAPEIIAMFPRDEEEVDSEAEEEERKRLEASGRDSPYTFVVDVWALGEMVFRLLSGGKPVFREGRHLANYVVRGRPFPDEPLKKLLVSADGIDFVAKAMARSAKQRLSARACAQHAWFAAATSLASGESHSASTLEFPLPERGVALHNADTKKRFSTSSSSLLLVQTNQKQQQQQQRLSTKEAWKENSNASPIEAGQDESARGPDPSGRWTERSWSTSSSRLGSASSHSTLRESAPSQTDVSSLNDQRSPRLRIPSPPLNSSMEEHMGDPGGLKRTSPSWTDSRELASWSRSLRRRAELPNDG